MDRQKDPSVYQSTIINVIMSLSKRQDSFALKASRRLAEYAWNAYT